MIAGHLTPRNQVRDELAGNRLTIAVGRRLGTVVLTLQGRLEGSDADFLAWMLEDLIEAQGNLSIVVDLRQLIHLDRAGADVLRAAIDAARRHGGVFGLSEPPLAVRHVILEAGLETGLVGPEPQRPTSRASMDSV